MLQHLIVRTSDAKRLKPLIKSALEREAKLLDHSIQRTLQVLAHYESRYGMTSENLKSTNLRKPWIISIGGWKLKLFDILKPSAHALRKSNLSDDYFQKIQAALSNSPFVCPTDYFGRRPRQSAFFRTDAHFIDVNYLQPAYYPLLACEKYQC